MSTFALLMVYTVVTLTQCLFAYCAVSYGIISHFKSHLTAIPLYCTQDTDADSAAGPFCSPRKEHVAELCSIVDSSVDTKWRHRMVGLNTQPDTPAINACVDTFISRFWSAKEPTQAYSLGSKFERYILCCEITQSFLINFSFTRPARSLITSLQWPRSQLCVSGTAGTVHSYANILGHAAN